MTAPTDYPTRWETHAVLKDGTTAELRPIRPDDRQDLDEFHRRQSKQSIYFRYFRHHPELSDKELDFFTQVDYRDRMAFVAHIGHRLVAVARYELLADHPDGRIAEVAFFVDDEFHGRGLGTLMLEYLAAAGRDNDLRGFTATVLPENYGMLAVFRSAGFEAETRFAGGVIEVDLSIDVTTETSAAIADRGRRSTARSVARLLEPTSVAVIGASRSPGNVGHELMRSLVAAAPGSPLAGRILPVNPTADQVVGLPAHPTIAAATDALESTVDLAVIAVRPSLVPEVMAECATAGVHGLLVVTTGFRRSSAPGMGIDAVQLVELARDNGMRMIGPGAFGLVNTDPDVGLAALIHPVRTRPGRVALASESGPLGAALLERMWTAGIGLSSFVGVGERADVSINDLLDYWDLDDRTAVVLLYVENHGNLRNFAVTARRTSASKPIVSVTPADPDVAELLRQSGVILVDEVAQLSDQASLAVSQPVTSGTRVVIVSNTASVARLAADACRRNGLDVVTPPLGEALGGGGKATTTTDGVLIGDLDTVELMPSGDPGDYEPIIVAAGAAQEADMLLVALAPTAYLGLNRLVQILDRVNRSVDKPVAAVGLVDADRVGVPNLPVFTFPEEAARALSRHARYGQWRGAHRPAAPEDTATARPAPAVIDELLAGRREARLTMVSPDLLRLVDELGVPLLRYEVATNPEEAAGAAERIGYPVVLKAGYLRRRSVGESGGAAIDLHDADAVQAAYRRMRDRLGIAMRAAIVQSMVPATGMARLHLRQEPSFGSMISIGPGGSANRSRPPAARCFLPLDDTGAEVVVDSLADALAGGDDPQPLDDPTRQVLADLVTALDAAATATPRLATLSLDPIMLAGADTTPVDAEVVLRATTDDALAGVRHL